MKFIRCIIPIQQQIDERRFDHFGTSVLLEIEGRHMLVSAAHVFLERNLWMFGEPKNVPLEDIAFSATSPDLAAVRNDSIDVAFGELPADIAAMLKGSGFEPLQMNDTAYVARPSSDRAAFSGFPCSKAELQIGLQQMRLQPAFVEGPLISQAELVGAGYDPEANLAIPYRREKQFDGRAKKPITGMEPYGMSGGPIWRFGNDGEPWLAGIGFKFDEAKKLLVGTRIEEVFALIQQQSIERWLAKRTKPVRKLVLDPKTGSLQAEP